jgi:hypothetical protein
MSTARNVTAEFAKIPYELSVDVNGGDGFGSVTSHVTGIDCPNECDAEFDAGTSVRLTATADQGYVFVGWSGACSGIGTCTVRVSEQKSVTATFEPSYGLELFKEGNGSGTVVWSTGGDACGAECEKDERFFRSGTSVTLTATPAAGSSFGGWGGACAEETGSVCTLKVEDDLDVEAFFDLVLTLKVTRTGPGSVLSMDGINCGSVCTASYFDGTVVVLTATPAVGSIIVGWSGGGCTGNASTCAVTMDQAKSVSVAFARTVLLTVSTAGSTGSGKIVSVPAGIDCSGTCSVSVPAGTLVTLTATPGPGSEFVGWIGRCSGILVPTCTVPMTLARSVGATFAPA